ncbi:MAG: hypothetical protein HeimC3_17340 [Candidatus Heimdallarchaeota archaeon LC_3]|nr:MAG: hypothetical protein HeimC3_17340 [Candidatus Heimdallarchaeota archaeon LC_3]
MGKYFSFFEQISLYSNILYTLISSIRFRTRVKLTLVKEVNILTKSDYMAEKILKEVNILKSKKILHPDDSVENVLLNHGETKEWADVFWRRRYQHENRSDPEIDLVFETSPTSVLEIGTGYGRILKKLDKERQRKKLSTKLFGIERCKHMESYFLLFKKQQPSLSDVEIYYENFFRSKQFRKRKFDVIVLPMNTFPSFHSKLDLLFRTVKNYLSEDGLFIFTSYKIPQNRTKEERRKGKYSGELLVEEEKKPILLEAFRFTETEGPYGIETVTYLIYYRFFEYYSIHKKYIYRLEHFVPQKNQIEKIITENGYKVKFFNDESHSLVFGCQTI